MPWTSRRLAGFVVVVLLAGCASGSSGGSGPIPTTSSSPASSVSAVPETTPSTGAVPSASLPTIDAGIASDQPCMNPNDDPTGVAGLGIAPRELEGLLLDRAALGLSGTGWSRDPWWSAYLHNVELVMLGAPAEACAVMRQLGRVIGYGAGYVDEATADELTQSVEIFRNEAGAAAYASWLAAGYLRSTPGATSEAIDQADGGVIMSGSTSAGDWTRVVFRSGANVATLAFTGATGHVPPVNLPTLATAFAARVDAARPTGRPYDLAHLMSATVPKAGLPPAFASLAWDPVFGGCWDKAEMVAQLADPTEVAKDIAAYGLEVQCLGMYSPQTDCPDATACATTAPDAAPPGIVRAATVVSVLASPKDARGYRASSLARIDAAASETGLEYFAVPGVPGAIGLRRHVTDGDVEEIDTRVSFSRGDIVATAFVHDRLDTDHRADVIAMAKALDTRMNQVLGTPTS